jgi:DNA-binding transcriptional ArsR family regulator
VPRSAAAAGEPLDEAMRALAEPRRRAILRLVASSELAAGEIAAAFDVTRTAVSQHLTVLKGAGLLSERREGTRRLYRARPEGLAELRQFLDEMWASALDDARRLVEADRAARDRAAGEPAAREDDDDDRG